MHVTMEWKPVLLHRKIFKQYNEIYISFRSDLFHSVHLNSTLLCSLLSIQRGSLFFKKKKTLKKLLRGHEYVSHFVGEFC